MNKVLQLSERWYHFDRIPCKRGCIDKWVGDINSNPNDIAQAQQNVNTNYIFYRMNDSFWFHKDCFTAGMWIFGQMNSDHHTAEEIWTHYFKESYEQS